MAPAGSEGGAYCRDLPLWRLQRIGAEQLNFLYENRGDAGVIQLLPGIAYCFRKFHALISDLVQGAWVRYVRQRNLTLIGETADLQEFLFGSERNSLATVRPVLLDLRRGRFFYGACRSLRGLARYPVDLAHNFVLADSGATARSATGSWPATSAGVGGTEGAVRRAVGRCARTAWDRGRTGDLQPGCAMGVCADGGSARVNVAARGRDGTAGGGVAGPDSSVTQTVVGSVPDIGQEP